jgi:hypothetical protein
MPDFSKMTEAEMFANDEAVFQQHLKDWEQDVDLAFYVVLDCGLGDTYCLLSLLPELRKKHENLILAVCYPQVFDGQDVKLISIADAQLLLGDITKYNLYKNLIDWGWTAKDGNLVDAFRRLYNV